MSRSGLAFMPLPFVDRGRGTRPRPGGVLVAAVAAAPRPFLCPALSRGLLGRLAFFGCRSGAVAVQLGGGRPWPGLRHAEAAEAFPGPSPRAPRTARFAEVGRRLVRTPLPTNASVPVSEVPRGCVAGRAALPRLARLLEGFGDGSRPTRGGAAAPRPCCCVSLKSSPFLGLKPGTRVAGGTSRGRWPAAVAGRLVRPGTQQRAPSVPPSGSVSRARRRRLALLRCGWPGAIEPFSVPGRPVASGLPARLLWLPAGWVCEQVRFFFPRARRCCRAEWGCPCPAYVVPLLFFLFLHFFLSRP